MLKKKLKPIDFVIFFVIATLLIVGLCWHYNHGKLRRNKNRFEESVYRGFEALALNNMRDAEIFFSAFFNEVGNEVDDFFKLSPRLQIRTRYVYGDMLFCRKDFRKAEIVWRPIFKDASSMLDFLSAGAPRKNILASYASALKENGNITEILKLFDICYDENGDARDILKKFQDDPLLRSIAGYFFFKRNEHKKVVNILRTLFENPKMLNKLNDEQRALIRWYYGCSLAYEDKSDHAKELLSSFFDAQMKETEIFELLDQKNQIACRVQYALMQLKENNIVNTVRLIEELFDEKGELIQKAKELPFQDLIRSIYGYILSKQEKYAEANKVWNWFFKSENKPFIKNFNGADINLLRSLRNNINRMYVNQW